MTKLTATAELELIGTKLRELLGHDNYAIITVDGRKRTSAWAKDLNSEDDQLIEQMEASNAPKLETEKALKKASASRKSIGSLQKYATEEQKSKSDIIILEERFWQRRKINTNKGGFVVWPLQTEDTIGYLVVPSQAEAQLVLDKLSY